MEKWISIIGWGFVWLTTLATSLASGAGFLGRTWWVFDLASHFRVQYFFILVGCLVVFLFGRQYIGGFMAAFFALANLVLILPFYSISKPAQAGTQSYRLVHLNVQQRNTSYEEVNRFINEVDADIIHFVEVDRAWLGALEPFREIYPYEVHHLEADKFGVLIYSRYPIQNHQVQFFGGTGRPSLIADIHLEGRRLTVIGTHPPPPVNQEKARERNRQISEVAKFAAGQEQPVIVVGDLNITSWSPYFDPILRSGLHDSRVGFGVHPSWPTTNRLVMVPIDHILISDGIHIHDRRLGREVGSDHLPVILDFPSNHDL